jgi:uncharacterized integral membrane protein
MTKFLTRAWWWLLGSMAFFSIFAFALNNRAVVTVHWFFGYESRIQLVLLVLLVLMLGVFLGAIAVLPLWWRQYQQKQQKPKLIAALTPLGAVASEPAVGHEVIDAV